MRTSPRLTAITSSLSFKLFLLLSSSILFLLVVFLVISGRQQRRQLESLVRNEALRTGDLIRQSLHVSMLRNERDRTYTMIRLFGAEPGVEAIRIYNKRGEIKFSSDQAEIGASVDLQAEACYVCHATAEPLSAVPTTERARLYEKNGSYRVLGLINPIYSTGGCVAAGCHTGDESILGVLDVQMSMQSVDQALAASGRRALAIGIAIIVVSMLLMAAVVYRAVHVPTKKLRHGTNELARGNLDVVIDLNRSDELGALAASFNDMAGSLRAADSELRTWSRTLEDRVRDKTEQLERLHQQMIQVEKATSLGKMAATVAHELNNPLSGILTSAKLVARQLGTQLPDGPDKTRTLENLDLVRSEAMRCGNIVRDLLTYARGSAGRFEAAHLHELVNRAVKLVVHHLELASVRVQTDLTLDDDRISCDHEQLVQALLALLINAVESMPGGGSLAVRTYASPGTPGSHVCISVGDTGVGIPESVQDRIFDPFFSTKNATKGVGLGLAVVYGIVQRHEGTIAVRSTVGVGSVFTLELPRDPEGAALARAKGVAAAVDL